MFLVVVGIEIMVGFIYCFLIEDRIIGLLIKYLFIMSKIKFIYFDVGGVLLLDFSGTNKWEIMMRDLGFVGENVKLFDKLWKLHTKRVCLDYDIDDFTEVLNRNTNVSLPHNYSMLDDFIDRFDLNTSLSKLTSSLALKYKLGLLTNMYPRMLPLINKNNLIPQLEWDSVIDSSVVGVEKPDIEIYKLAEKKAKCDGNEILFVDNLEENLLVPQQMGWQTFLYDSVDPERSTQELVQQLNI